MLDERRLPVGPFTLDANVTVAKRKEWIRTLADAPAVVREAVAGVDEVQLDTPYREGGWTPRQVVHHLADAHMNGFVRFKLALTEDHPAIKTYEEDLWGETADVRQASVELSLGLLDALHARWTILLESLTDEQFNRAFRHPERGVMTIDKAIQLYAWHGVHHAGHIQGLRRRSGW
jgi:hypothetical protein